MADHLLLSSPSISWAECRLLDQLTPTYVRQSETFPTLPPLPFSVFLSYPAPFSPIRFVATLLFFFLSTSIIFLFSLDCCPPFPSGTIILLFPSLSFPPSRVMAVKQACAHGRPLTGRPSESELSYRTKRLQTFGPQTFIASLWWKMLSKKSRTCCILICSNNNYSAGTP